MNENELTMKRTTITQDDFDDVAIQRTGLAGCTYDRDDAIRVASVVERRLGIRMSMAEAMDFWHWRSVVWDSSGLSHRTDDEIVDFFEQYVRSSLSDGDEEREDELDAIEAVMMDEACKKWLVTMTKETYADLQAKSSPAFDSQSLIRQDHPGILSFRPYVEETHDGEHDALDLPRMKRHVAWIARLIDQMIGRAVWEDEHITFRDENSDDVPTDEDMQMIMADVGLVGLLAGKLSEPLVRHIERIRSDYEKHARRWKEDV